MAASIYIVKMPVSGRSTVRNQVDICVVTAESAADARAVCESIHGQAGPVWDDASVAATVPASVALSGDLVGWQLYVQVEGTKYEATVVAGSGDSLDDLATDTAAALVAQGIATAAYDDTTQVLTVAGAAANLGDKALDVRLIPPGGTRTVAGLIASKADQGAVGAALTVTFRADTYTLPTIHEAAQSHSQS